MLDKIFSVTSNWLDGFELVFSRKENFTKLVNFTKLINHYYNVEPCFWVPWRKNSTAGGMNFYWPLLDPVLTSFKQSISQGLSGVLCIVAGLGPRMHHDELPWDPTQHNLHSVQLSHLSDSYSSQIASNVIIDCFVYSAYHQMALY